MTSYELDALRGMTEKEIRRAQSIVAAQIPIAYRERNTVALALLHEWEGDYTDELVRRLAR